MNAEDMIALREYKRPLIHRAVEYIGALERELAEKDAAGRALAQVLLNSSQFSAGPHEDVCIACHKPTWKHVDDACEWAQALAACPSEWKEDS